MGRSNIGIDLDGRLEGDKGNRSAKLNVPSLLLFTEHPPHEEADKEIEDFIKNNEENATRKKIEGVEHMEFTAYPLIDWVAGGNRSEEGKKAHIQATEEMLKFMKSVLEK